MGKQNPTGTRRLRSAAGEVGKCGHGVADTGFAFQTPGRTRELFYLFTVCIAASG